MVGDELGILFWIAATTPSYNSYANLVSRNSEIIYLEVSQYVHRPGAIVLDISSLLQKTTDDKEEEYKMKLLVLVREE